VRCHLPLFINLNNRSLFQIPSITLHVLPTNTSQSAIEVFQRTQSSAAAFIVAATPVRSLQSKVRNPPDALETVPDFQADLNLPAPIRRPEKKKTQHQEPRAESTIMAHTRPTPGSSSNPIDLTSRPLTATIADPGTYVGADAAMMATDPAAITGPAAGTGSFTGTGTLMDAGPATNTGMSLTTGTVSGPANGSVPGTPTTPTSAAAGGVLSGRVAKGKTKTTTTKKATPKKKAAVAAAAANPGNNNSNNNDSPSGSNADTDSPNPPKRGKASSGLPSCLPCRRAKSRCDRVVACVRCVKADKECVSHAEEGASSAVGGGGGGKAGGGSKACERCRKMKAACVRTETCVRCEKRGVECVMA
jgi:hypothetical protein